MGLQTLSPDAFVSKFPEICASIPDTVLARSVHIYDEDVALDGDLNLDTARDDGERGASVYLCDLNVNGNILNSNTDGGRALVVKGKLTAHNLVGGGACIRLAEAEISGVVLGHYNHGTLYGDELKALMLISDDHDTWFRKEDVALSFNGFGGMEHVYLDGMQMDASSSQWRDSLVSAFFHGPMADFFKGTPWFSFWADTQGDWKEYKGAAPSDYPGLNAEDASMDWVQWIFHELRDEAGPVPVSFQAFVDLAKKHIVLPEEGENDHASG